jgi:uncharacterized membrane protein
MSEPRVVVRKEEKRGRRPIRPWDDEIAYRVVGWLGLLFVLVALGDVALAFYPLGFGSPEWEVGTVAATVQGFPLLTLGLVGIWAAGGQRADRRLLAGVGVAFVLAAITLLLMLTLMMTDVPIAWRGTQQDPLARTGILKLIVKTLYLGMLFTVAYGIAGWLALKQARGGSTE